jgi:uncharacterized protein
MVETGSDIPTKWQNPETDYDHVKRDEMIPMRDGVKLQAVIFFPKGTHDLPMLLERTPHDTKPFLRTTAGISATREALAAAERASVATRAPLQ